MTPKKAAAYFVAAILSAAWFASAVGVPSQPPPRPARASSDEARLDALARDVQAQSSRLRKRLAAAPAVQAPPRNPFAFGPGEPAGQELARGPVAPVTAVDPYPEPDLVPREPLLALIGVAEQKTPEGLVRTAMISEDGELLHMATPGQTVSGRYTIVTVSTDAVELKDVSTGLTRRLVLR